MLCVTVLCAYSVHTLCAHCAQSTAQELAMARVTRSQQDQIQSYEAHKYYSLDKVKLLFISIQGSLEKAGIVSQL